MHGASSWKDYFKVNTDHKVIGIQYLVVVFAFLVIGGIFAELVRTELATPGQTIGDGETYNGLFSVHATLMIFLFVIPAFAGLANYVLPIMIGAKDMAFPRLNALSLWMLIPGGLMMAISPVFGAFSAGWTAYTPLATQGGTGTTLFEIGVQLVGSSSIATALNFLVTIFTMRAPGMTVWRMPLLVWANATTSALVVFGTPFIAGSQFMTLFDRVMGTSFFNPLGGGDVIMYQHVFWFYSHPAVYIMILPGFGIISEVVATFSRKPIFGYRAIAFSTVAIAVLGFGVWAHHMFVSGMAPWLRVPMMITTVIIAVPTGVKVFSWLGTLWNGKIHLKTPMLYAMGFICTFVIGGLSGVMLRHDPGRHPRDGHLLRGGPHPLRVRRRQPLHDLRGRPLLVPEDDREDVQRAPGPDQLLDHLHRLQRDLHADALARPAGHAPARLDVRLPLRGPEPVHRGRLDGDDRGHPDLLLQHDPLVGGGARRPRGTPGAGARSSGSSPRRRRSSTSRRRPRSWAARTSTAMPGARHAVVFAPEEIGGELTETEKRTILVLADETVAADALVAEIRERAASGLWRFTIAVPNEGGDSKAADRRLQATLSVLAEAGIDASGTVVEGDPFAATELVTSEEDVHEILLATYPTGQSAWMRADMVDRLRKSSGLGITRVVVSREEAREPLAQPGVTQVAVLADEALGAEGLVDALRQRSDERPIGVVLLNPMALEVARVDRRGRGAAQRAPSTGCAPPSTPCRERACSPRRGARRRRRPRPRAVAVAEHGADEILVVATRGGRLDSVDTLEKVRPPWAPCRPRDRRRCGGAGLPLRELAGHGHRRSARERVPPGRDPPVSRGSQMSMGMLAMMFFLGSEAMLFASFFTAYFFVRFNVADQWPPLNADGRAVRAAEGHHRASTRRSWSRRASRCTGASTGSSHYGDRKGLRAGPAGRDAPAGRDVPDHPDQRVRAPRLHAPGTALRLGLLLADRPARPPRLRRADDPDALLHPGEDGARFPPTWFTPLGAGSLYWHFVDVVWVLLYVLVYIAMSARTMRCGAGRLAAVAIALAGSRSAGCGSADSGERRPRRRQADLHEPLRQLPHARGGRHAAGQRSARTWTTPSAPRARSA